MKINEWPRHGIQALWAFITNSHVTGFVTGKIYTGKLKNACVPGLNCYSCPGAVGACPIGSLQAVIGSWNFKMAYYVVGFLIFIGAMVGRLICGFLCPFGLIQDLLNKIPFPKKIRTFKGDKHITRYEMAQITARLLAKRDSLSADQQSVVDMLSREYANDLSSLGVRISELEKKTGKTSLLTELRVQGIDRYDDIFKDKKEKHYELGARVRLNTMTKINDRSTLYGQLETYMGMNGRDPYDINKYTYDKNGNESVRAGHSDGELHLNRLWTTFQFGKKQDTTNLPFGPSKNLIGIGQFPVKMGVTGYTFDVYFKVAFFTF